MGSEGVVPSPSGSDSKPLRVTSRFEAQEPQDAAPRSSEAAPRPTRAGAKRWSGAVDVRECCGDRRSDARRASMAALLQAAPPAALDEGSTDTRQVLLLAPKRGGAPVGIIGRPWATSEVCALDSNLPAPPRLEDRRTPADPRFFR